MVTDPLHPQIGPAIVNPGTGPVLVAELTHAEANLPKLLSDAACEGATIERQPDGDSEGRFSFIVKLGGRECEIDMPGWPLDKVRFLGKPQNIWDFPRLYVGGSSWVWKYAVNMVRAALTEDPEEDQ